MGTVGAWGLSWPVRMVGAGVLAVLLSLVLAMTSGFDAAAAARPGALEVGEADRDAKDPEEAEDSDDDGIVERPDAVSASVTAQLLGKPVEDLSARTETLRRLVNPDGTFTDEMTSAAVRVQDEESGEWEPVSYDLVETPDGDFEPEASAADVTVGGGGSKEAVDVGFDDGSSLAVRWPAKLPEPVIEGGIATYRVSEAADLVVTMTGSGATTHLRLNERPAEDDPVFDFLLRADELGIKETASGGLKVTDGGKQVGMVSSLVAYDAQRDDAGIPTNVVSLESDLSAGVEKAAGTDHVLSLRAPEGFLDDPDTQYPVTIDPDIAALTFAQDTWVRQGMSAVQGAKPQVVVGRQATDTNTNYGIAFMQWSNAQIAGKTVTNATLKLYQYHAGSCDSRSMTIYPTWSAWNEANTTWTNKPTQASGTGTNVTLSGNYGRAGCAAGDAFVTANLTLMAQKWGFGPSNGGFANYGIAMWPGSLTDATYEKAFCSSEPLAGNTCGSATKVPVLSVTYNGPPNAATVPTPAVGTPMRTWQGVNYVASTKPRWLTSATDSDRTRLYYEVEVHNSTAGTAASLRSSCETADRGDQGRIDGCAPTTALINGHAYYVRARARDVYTLTGPWSGWRYFIVDAAVPVVPSATCTGVAAGQWYETRPAASTTCTVSGNGADIDWRVNGVTKPALSTSATTSSIAIPESGFTMIEFRSRTRAGAVSAWKQIGFGTGPAALLEPLADDRSSDAFPVLAAAPAGAETAKVQWRFAPQDDSGTGPEDGWTDASGVKKANGDSWPGTLAGVTGMSQTPALTWTPKVESGIASTALVQVRVVFAYPGGISKASPMQRVQVVPHAFGGSFPTSVAGPGQVALFTGEFQHSETDVVVPGYGEAISLGRSYLSMAGTATGPAGVFGPGWKADLSGPEAGVAGFSVVDRTEVDGAIVLNDPDGASYVYRHSSGKAGAQLAGDYVGVGETALDEDKLTLQPVTEPGITHRLTL